MARRLPLQSLALLPLLLVLPAQAQDQEILPVNVTFAISTGFWTGTQGLLGALDPGLTIKAPGTVAADATDKPQRGYYKLVAVRQPDGTAKIHLQQIGLSAKGPELLSSIELDEFSALKPYVTDIRPESSSGTAASPGLFATVHLKTDPKAVEAESWTIIVDDLGELKIERATN
ncbi:hypothetical protein [Pararhizobium sp.]|uniref:hypothetical protein n=1 Tax=Pararhizobium sp. TaxID=1977563 RepID=UPI0027190214|nr:hypothetical protein [Pararhizobium sp.]MDO9415861.1 hypothetical protein [Pararhizobium sp.]